MKKKSEFFSIIFIEQNYITDRCVTMVEIHF